jgi:hypothetical protein
MSKPVALNVHTLRFSTEEVVINSDVFTWVRPGDVLAIYPADRPETDRLAIRVTKLGVTKSKHGRATLQVSLSKGIADRFSLLPMQDVIVERVDPQKIGLDAIQLTFDSQYLSRSVLWRISRYLKKKISTEHACREGSRLIFWDTSSACRTCSSTDPRSREAWCSRSPR